MTTFSQQEVEFLQNHGNEVGRRTWLCVFDPKTDGCSDMKDSQKFKEFLQDKYEKKKWHFSKSKNRRDVEGPWSPGVQAVPPSHGPLASQAPSHNMPPNARSARPLSQSQMLSWDRNPAISPADMRTDVFTARPSRSQSFRDPPLKDPTLCGIERQRPGSLTSALGAQSHTPSFPALPRPSASSSFKNHFTLGFPTSKPRLKACEGQGETHTVASLEKKNEFKVVQYLPQGPRGPSGLSPSLSASTSEVSATLSSSLCLSLCPSHSSSRSSLWALARQRRRRSAAPTPRTDTPQCHTWTASSQTRQQAQPHLLALRSTARSLETGCPPAQLLPAPPVSIQSPAPKPLRISQTHSAPARPPSSPLPSPPVTPSVTLQEVTPMHLSHHPPLFFLHPPPSQHPPPRMHFLMSQPATKKPTVLPPFLHLTLSPKSLELCR
ncbi:arf-GAP domain and FG repeat-containing protein 2 isoform X4 [Cheilinus undulatus]|nr:arf-GAP domain and FG repeat-containing protein 2 isoform X4 [Cheilinus undulatus]